MSEPLRDFELGLGCKEMIGMIAHETFGHRHTKFKVGNRGRRRKPIRMGDPVLCSCGELIKCRGPIALEFSRPREQVVPGAPCAGGLPRRQLSGAESKSCLRFNIHRYGRAGSWILLAIIVQEAPISGDRFRAAVRFFQTTRNAKAKLL